MIAIYVRQSLDKKDSISIETQVDFCKKEFDSSSETFKVYEDKGFSGKNTNRPSFNNMVQDIKAGVISRVIVYKLDRISRSTLDFANIMDIYKRHNVEFTSCTEKFDTSTPIGKAMLQIIMVFAELERETIQQRVTHNYYERGKRGFFLGGTIPYGYKKIPVIIEGKKTSTFSEIPNEVEALLKMYDLYSTTDMSLGKISNYLNENKILAPKGGRWDSNKISRIMKNPIYVKADADVYLYYKNKGCIISNDVSDFIGINGCYIFGKREANERKYTNVENHVLSLGLHKGIIDSDTWLKCQYKLEQNKQIKNSGQGKHSWLSGLTKCGYCGYAVSVVATKGTDYRYFNCRGKTNLKICKGHSRVLNVSEIEDIVEEKLLERVEELKNQSDIFETRESKNNADIKIQITQIDEQIENLINQLAEANNVSMKYINNKIQSLDSKKNSLIEEMKKTTLSNKKNISVIEVIEDMKGWDKHDIEKKKELCKHFISKISITDDEVNVDWVL